MDTQQYKTRAQFQTHDGGLTNIVHAPSDSNMHVISPATTTITGLPSFIETEEIDELEEDNEINKFLA